MPAISRVVVKPSLGSGFQKSFFGFKKLEHDCKSLKTKTALWLVTREMCVAVSEGSSCKEYSYYILTVTNTMAANKMKN